MTKDDISRDNDSSKGQEADRKTTSPASSQQPAAPDSPKQHVSPDVKPSPGAPSKPPSPKPQAESTQKTSKTTDKLPPAPAEPSPKQESKSSAAPQSPAKPEKAKEASPKASSKPPLTQMAPPKQEPKPSAGSTSPADAGATQGASGVATEEPSQSAAQPAVKKQMCANCGAENKLSDVYCYRCGQLLPSVQLTEGESKKRPEQLASGKLDDPSEQLPADTNRPGTAILTNNTDQLVLPKKRWGTARLDNESLIIFRVKDTKQEVHVYLQDDEVVMGRSFGEIQVDVDLTQHNAAEFGVSRRHAVLKRQNDNVVVTDLGSVNHTFLNGHQIIPHEFRILRDGDELRLGKLVLRVYFGEVM